LENLGLGFDVVVVLLAALAGGFLANRLKLPVLLGYLIAGMIVSPYSLGLVQDIAAIENLANIGVIMLLFTLGLEFSFDELRRVGKVAVFGGIAQVILTGGAGTLFGKVLGWATPEAIFFGLVLTMSSTLVVLKLLLDRNELDSVHGRVMIGLLLVEDLFVIPLMIIMPTLGTSGTEVFPALFEAGGKAIGFIIIMIGAGLLFLPRVLNRIAGTRSKELFLISVVAITLAAAIASQLFGVSAAIGAFIAGLLTGRSIFARQALADIVPFRDAFGALFFVSLGTLVDSRFLTNNVALLVGVVVFIFITKFIIYTGIPWVFGFNARTSIITGTCLAQIGEFSFVLAGVGVASGILSDGTYALILGSAIVTMVQTPFLLSGTNHLYNRLKSTVIGKRILSIRPETEPHALSSMGGHTVICGGGRAASSLIKILSRRNLPYLIIDLDPQVISRSRKTGVPCLYGDASKFEVLHGAFLEKAKLLVCTFPSFLDIQLTVENARSINPKLDIIVRVERDSDEVTLRKVNVNELVKPQFEAGLEITRHALRRYGLSIVEIEFILNSLRGGKMS